MSVRSGQSVTTEFTTRAFATGAATDATGTPTGTLYVNGTANAATVTVTNQATGVYKAAVTLPTLAVGDVVSIIINATVSGVTDNAKIWEDSKDVFAGAIPDVVAGGSGGLFISGSNTGTTTFGALTVTGAVSFGSTFSTTGTTTFNAFTVTNATTLSGAVSLGSTLGVTGTTTLAAVNTGAIGTGNLTITGTLSTSGTTTLNALTVTNAFTVSGATTFTGAISGTNASNDLRGILLQATQAGVTIPTVTTVTNQLTAAAIATGVWQDTTAGDFTVASSIGKSLYTTGNAPGAASGLALVGSNMGTVTSVSGAVGSVTGNVGGNVVGTVASVVGAVGSVTGNVGGNVTGSVGSIASGGIAAASFAAGAIDSGALAATAVAEIWAYTGSGTASAFTMLGNTYQATVASASGSVNDAAATTTSFKTTLTEVDNFWNDALLVFTSGALAGQSRPITTYTQINGVITFDEALTSAPANSVTFVIQAAHIHPVSQIATGVWQDSTAGDFTVANSVGKSLYNAFTANTSVFTTASLVNAPTGGSAPTAAQIATAVWQDTTAGDFTVSSSIGKSLYTSGNAPGTASGLAIVGSNMGTVSSVSGAVGSVTGNVGGNVVGSVGSVTGNVGGNVVGSVASVSGAVGSVTGMTNATIASAVHTTAMTESYNTDGSAATLAQACYVMMQMMTEISFSSTTATVKRLDGSTTAYTLTINDATTPTSITRST